MEVEATQPSTLPLNHGAYLAEEYDDVICILQPASQSALAVCHEIWNVCPQFILQSSNTGLRADGTVQEEDDLEMIGGEDTQGPSITPRKPTDLISNNDRVRPTALDIALRTSSPIRDVLVGFTFGREPIKSDIIFKAGGPGDQRVSGLHFRIYLNSYGFLMLEDLSTNGTTVDGETLGQKYKNTTKTVSHGTNIDVVTNVHRETKAIEHARFIVKLPNRNDSEYKKNLGDYLAKIARLKQERKQTNDGEMFPKPTHTGKLRNLEAPMGMDIAAGTKQYSLADGWTANGKYRVVGEVGKGAFAMVYKIVGNNGGEPRAAKRIDRANFVKNGIMDGKFLSELNIMQKIDHPHVIHFHDYDLTTKHLFIVMEYMPYGDLAPYAQPKGYLGLSTLKSITRQLLHALAYIHRNGIVHRDIKPENVLVQSKDPFFVKLSDFGLSKMIDKEDAAVFITFCGTLLYCAPEIYPDYEQVRAGLPRVKRKSSAPKPYSSAVDIWSLGTVMYHLIASKPPFKGSGEEQGYKMLRAVICDELNFKPLIERGVDKNGVAFFSSMIDIDGENRPSAKKLLSHPWMQDVPDITTIPDLEESQIVGNLADEHLEALREEDEWDKSESESFIKATEALIKTPTPEAPSLTTGETSADDKVPVTENDNSDVSSQVDVEIGSEATSRIETTEMIHQGSARWEEDDSIGSGQSGTSWFKKPWPPHYGKEQAVEGTPSASEDETPRQARTSRLFGEISQAPSQESGVSEGNMQPAFDSGNASPTLPSPNSPSLNGAESKMNNLNMKGSRAPKSILRSAVTNSMLNGKRYRSSTASGSDESNTSSVDEPAAKRSMIRQSEPVSPEVSFNAGLRKSIDITKSLSQKVDDLQLGTRLATLTPLPGCLSSTEVLLTTRLSTFGRAAGNTNVYENPKDSRIPRSAFDIYFFSPGTAHIRNHAWHKEPNLHAVVMTRCSSGIKVNGTRIPPSTAGTVFKVAQLYTGDKIEVYNSGRNKLVYSCEFHVSNSHYLRGADEPVVVEDNTELYQAANSGSSGKGS